MLLVKLKKELKLKAKQIFYRDFLKQALESMDKEIFL